MKKLLVILLLLFPVHGAWGHDLSGEIYFQCWETDRSMRTNNRKGRYPQWFSINYKTQKITGYNREWEVTESADRIKSLNFSDTNIKWRLTIPGFQVKNRYEFSFGKVGGELKEELHEIQKDGRAKYMWTYWYNCSKREKKF